jgi:hypothetical protein
MSKLVREIHVRIETGKVLRIFTNDLTASAQGIADLYRRRWAIKLFFRWVKQTLKITHFFGTSDNAVRIQIAVALIAVLLLRLAHEANKIVASPLTFARLIRANLMHRRQIAELLKPPSAKPEPKQPEFDFGLHATSGGAPPPNCACSRRQGGGGMIGTNRAGRSWVKPGNDGG